MHRSNHDNDEAIEAFERYLSLIKDKDPKAAEGVSAEIEALGGKPGRPAKRPKKHR
jgi:hypothetical protein